MAKKKPAKRKTRRTRRDPRISRYAAMTGEGLVDELIRIAEGR